MKTFSEAIKMNDSTFFNLEYHQKRINRTLQHFYQTEIDISIIKDIIPSYAKEGLFKCRVVYSDIIEKVEFIPYFFRYLGEIGVVTDDEINYSYKYTDRSKINELLQKSGCDDIIIVKNGFVTDSSFSNLVFKSSKGFFTPRDCLLPGTKRQLLLDKNLIKDIRIHVNDIHKFDEVYFINAMIDITDEMKIETSSLVYL